MKHPFLTLMCLMSLLSGALAQTVEVELENERIHLGAYAIMNLTIDGARGSIEAKLPEVDGLEFRQVGNRSYQNVEIINGSVTSRQGLVQTFMVVPARAGVFTIPPFNVMIEGSAYPTKALRLTVAQAPALPAPPASGPSGRPAGPQQQPAAAPRQVEAAMIQVQMPEGPFYAGQRIPVTIKALFHNEVQLRQLTPVRVLAPDFIVGPFNNHHTEALEHVDGIPYRAIIWTSHLDAIKDGRFPVSAEVQAHVLMPGGQPRIGPFGEDFLNDPAVRQIFQQMSYQPQNLALKSTNQTVTVDPLPEEGRPAGFTGAVGNFRISTSATPVRVAAGDPVALTIRVEGEGNFDRVEAPAIASTPNLKTYTPTVKAAAAPGGGKSFEQILVPMNSSVRDLPGLDFSYFDPSQRRYVETRTSPIPLEVTGSTSPAAGSAGTTAATASAGVPMDLVANKSSVGTTASSLRPVVTRGWFLAANAAPVLLLGIALGLHLRRVHLERNPSILRLQQVSRAVQGHLHKARRAASNNNASSFFEEARRAVQQQMAETLHQSPESITLAEIRGNSSLTPELRDAVAGLFEQADAVAYSGQTFQAARLQDWERQLSEILHALKGVHS